MMRKRCNGNGALVILCAALAALPAPAAGAQGNPTAWERVFSDTGDSAWREAFFSRVMERSGNETIYSTAFLLAARLCVETGVLGSPEAAAEIFVRTAIQASRAIRSGVPAPRAGTALRAALGNDYKRYEAAGLNAGIRGKMREMKRNIRRVPDPPGRTGGHGNSGASGAGSGTDSGTDNGPDSQSGNARGGVVSGG